MRASWRSSDRDCKLIGPNPFFTPFNVFWPLTLCLTFGVHSRSSRRDRIVWGKVRDRKPGHRRTVNGGSLRAGKLQAGIATSQGQQGECWRGWDDRPAVARVPETALASHPGKVV